MNKLKQFSLAVFTGLIGCVPAFVVAAPVDSAPTQMVVVLKNGTQQTFNTAEVLRVDFVSVQISGGIDISGTWRRNQESSTWTFRPSADGRYVAQENGFAQVSGPAYFTPSGTFRIDYRSRDGVYTGNAEMRFGMDGRTASGTWNSYTPSRETSNVTWTRVN